MFDEALRRRAAEIETNWKAANDQQKKRLGVHVDYLIEKDLIDDFVAWEKNKTEESQQ